MTSTEDQIRNALADLAPTAPADGSAFSGVGRRITRRRRQRTAARLAAVAAVALVAVAGASLVGGRDEPSGFATQPDDDSALPDGTTVPDGTTLPDAGPTIGVPNEVIGTAQFVLPAGWETTLRPGFWIDPDAPGGSTTVRHPYTEMCLRRIADPGPLDCTLQMFHGEVPGSEAFQAYDPEGEWSWYHGTDVMACPDGTDPGGESLDRVQPAGGDRTPVVTDVTDVGSRSANHSVWNAVCERSGFEFSPQAWFLPNSQILIVDVLGQPETEALLASFIFGDEAG